MISITFRKNLFRLNAAFLILMGGVFGVLDYLGFRMGSGPLGDLLKDNLLAIGMQEAHGLAFIIGLILFSYALRSTDTSWHLVGAGVHVLLGSSNLIFWGHFEEIGTVNPAIIVTAIHWLFVLTHLLSYFSARTKTQSFG